jgi:hypothetical protein
VDGPLRKKFYNKFLHSLECKSNKDHFGSNLYNWINNKEDRLRENIPQTLDNGFTRQEITFYRQYSHGIPTEEEILHELKTQIELIPENIIYNTPIEQQWKAYNEIINNNVLLIDITNNAAILCYSINRQTRRAAGILHTTSKDKDNTEEEEQTINKKHKTKPLDIKDILYMLTHTTGDVPIVIMFLEFYFKTITTIKTIKTDKINSNRSRRQRTIY